MGRIAGLLLGIVGCLVLICLVGRRGVFEETQSQTVFAVTPVQQSQESPESQETELQFPFRISGTELIAQNLVCYDGPFIEDGSDTPVCATMALVVRNEGQQEITWMKAELVGEQGTYVFEASNILPGMSVMILESEEARYSKERIFSSNGQAYTKKHDECIFLQLQLTPVDMGAIQVCNTSDSAIENLRLFHKNYIPEDLYVGGITYCTCVERLEAGQTIVIYPDHYAQGYSRIFKAEAD